jgi:hypothetical protein
MCFLLAVAFREAWGLPLLESLSRSVSDTWPRQPSAASAACAAASADAMPCSSSLAVSLVRFAFAVFASFPFCFFCLCFLFLSFLPFSFLLLFT